MQLIWEGFVEALRLLLGGDEALYEIALRSLWVSGLALAIAVVLGIPLGGLIALTSFWGRRLTVTVVNTGMAAPPVVVGLLVALFLTRSGPLGEFRLLYSNWAMVIAQVIIALPIMTGLSLAALQQLDVGLRQQIAALGANRLQAFFCQLREIRVALLAAVMAAFGAVISEVGAVMMVGGNIKGQTQVLTGAIVQETRMGRFANAIALAIILVSLAFTANLVLTAIQQQGRRV
ncbi:MAG: ABC transporter permease [Thermoleophilia bacterium]|nr:ABC transporter permease [Thermoleophilia bacterium]